ncbi:paired box Pax-7-like protein, partial [Sarcoptes scabiei]
VIGGSKPRVATPDIEKRIEEYRKENPVGYYEVQMDFETIQALKVSTSTLLTEFSVVFKTNVSLK